MLSVTATTYGIRDKRGRGRRGETTREGREHKKAWASFADEEALKGRGEGGRTYSEFCKYRPQDPAFPAREKEGTKDQLRTKERTKEKRAGGEAHFGR